MPTRGAWPYRDDATARDDPGAVHPHERRSGQRVQTAREFETTNGAAARGGAMDVAGPVVVGGMLFTTSGYALYGATRGSVLLAFSIDGK